MELTREQTIRALECCENQNSCKGCPLLFRSDSCDKALKANTLRYLKEKEPAPDTSEDKLKAKIVHTDDSTSKQICQAYDTADEACTDILDIYEGMSACERRAFDIGEVYGKICSTRDKLENMRGAN